MLRMCKFYSLKPISPEVRKNFKLPSWPFFHSASGPLPDSCLEYFQSLGIIHWNDPNSKTKGVPNSIQVPDSSGVLVSNYEPPLMVKAYRNLVAIDLDTFGVADIPRDMMNGVDPAKWLSFYGDLKWWLECNTEGDIVSISNTRVKFINVKKPEGLGLSDITSFRSTTRN